MAPARFVVATLLVVALAWVWHDDHWQGWRDALAAWLNDKAPSVMATTKAEPPATAPPPSVRIHASRDATGVLQFSQPGQPPGTVANYETATTGTIADYDRALKETRGIGPEQIAAARRAQQVAASAPPSSPASPPESATDAQSLAVRQAYELMAAQQKMQDAVRRQNGNSPALRETLQ